MELLAKIVDSFFAINYSRKNSIVRVWLGYKYVSGIFGSINDKNNDDDDEVNKMVFWNSW